MKKILCSVVLAAVAATSDAADVPGAFAFDMSSRYVLYVQKSFGSARQRTPPLEFGLSFERRRSEIFVLGENSRRFDKAIDFRVASSGDLRVNGMRLDFGGAERISYSGGSYGDDYWSIDNPWVWIAVAVGLVAAACVTETVLCEKRNSSSSSPAYRPPS